MRFIHVCILALSLLTSAAGPAFAQGTPPAPPAKVEHEIPDDVKSAWACVIGGSTGTGAAIIAGSENLINVVAGGIVSPKNPTVLMLGLAGVVFTTFCTLGQQLMPLYQYYWQNNGVSEPIEAHGPPPASVPDPNQSMFTSQLPPVIQ